jgi:unsaturated rhamnogalacturonyl hydrolase
VRRRRLRAALTAAALTTVTLAALPAAVPPANAAPALTRPVPTGDPALTRPVPAASLTPPDPAAARDWSAAVVDSTMARYTPAGIGGWSYPVGLYLYGQYLVYRRTHDPRLLSYIKAYVDRFVRSDGTIDQSFNSLDSMQAGRLLVLLHHETGQDRYRKAARKIRDRLNSYPRTSDGGFWHADTSSRAHQLWADGAYMVNPFLVEYGREFGDSAYTNDEAARQLSVYGGHLQVANGLLRHAYDESRSASWADPASGLAPEHWCRGAGRRPRRDPRRPASASPTP